MKIVISRYKIGDRVVLCDSPMSGNGLYFPDIGVRGTVTAVDSAGNCRVLWDIGVVEASDGKGWWVSDIYIRREYQTEHEFGEHDFEFDDTDVSVLWEE